MLPAAEEEMASLPKSKVQGLRYWTSPVNEGVEPPHTQYPKRTSTGAKETAATEILVANGWSMARSMIASAI